MNPKIDAYFDEVKRLDLQQPGDFPVIERIAREAYGTLNVLSCMNTRAAKAASASIKKIEAMLKIRECRVCGCTEDNCKQCVKKTGEPCHWVEWDLCSACITKQKK